jgi:hypothetical protein
MDAIIYIMVMRSSAALVYKPVLNNFVSSIRVAWRGNEIKNLQKESGILLEADFWHFQAILVHGFPLNMG